MEHLPESFQRIFRSFRTTTEVGSNPFGFYVDFGQYDPQSEQVQMHTRIVTSPEHAKIMAGILSSSVDGFELEHGTIPASSEEVDAMEVVLE
jgi:hypothetical protein